MNNQPKKSIIIIAVIILIILVAGAYFLFRGSHAPAYSFVAVKSGEIQEEADLTGNVKPAESVDLAFERSAKIAAANFKVGDQVKAGEIIASLNSSDLAAQLMQAQAARDVQAAMLKNLQAGTRPEDIQVSAIAVQNAQNSIVDAQNNLRNAENKANNDLATLYSKSNDILNDAYAKAFDALYNKTDGIFNNASSGHASLTFQLNDSALKNTVEMKRQSVNQELAAMKTGIDNLSSDQTAIDSGLSQALAPLGVIRDYLNQLNDALNFAVTSSLTPQEQILAYKSSMSLGIAGINTAITNINNQIKAIATQKITNQNSLATAQAQLNQAENNLALAQKQLTLKQAGATAEQIAAQAAAVNQAAAAVENIRAQLAKSILTSPLDGTISRQDAKAGEIAPLNTPLISIISNSKFQIDAQAPEADIEKIKIGQTAEVTLDADNSQKIFSAKVIAVDPAKTVINGATTYKVTLEFLEDDPLIKDGLTANIKINTESKTQALLVPTSSIIKTYDKQVVLVDNGSDGITQKIVTTGISQNGLTEILTGLSQGERVAIFGR